MATEWTRDKSCILEVKVTTGPLVRTVRGSAGPSDRPGRWQWSIVVRVGEHPTRGHILRSERDYLDEPMDAQELRERVMAIVGGMTDA